MLKKKLLTLLTVFALLTVGICGSFLPLPKASAAALIYDDFETGLNGWDQEDRKPSNLPPRKLTREDTV